MSEIDNFPDGPRKSNREAAGTLDEQARAILRGIEDFDLPQGSLAIHKIYMLFFSVVKRSVQKTTNYRLDVSEVEEIVQETFLHALRRLKQGNLDIDHFYMTAWLMTIAKHVIVDRIRKTKREVQPDEDDNFENIADKQIPGSDPSGPLLGDLRLSVAFERCLARLPAAKVQAFLLSKEGGLKHKEIAIALSIEPDKVASYIRSVKEAFRADPDIVKIIERRKSK